MARVDKSDPPETPAKVLLAAGIAAGPLFYTAIIAQAFTRPGFSLVRHPLSLLSVGSAGWVQRAAFVATGALVIAGSVGLAAPVARRFGSKWAVRLIAVFGAGTLLAGIFKPDAAMGFPPGAPETPPTMSSHSIIHGLCFDVAFAAVIVAAIMMGLIYRKRKNPMAEFSFLCGLALPLFIGIGIGSRSAMGAFFFIAGAIAFGWNSAICLENMSPPTNP